MSDPQSIPVYELKTKMEGGKEWVWDMLRKKYLVLTPEEHVRQCLLRFLNEEKGFPLLLMSVERGLRYNQRQKRYDVVAYNRHGKPLVAMECKAPYIDLSEDTVFQLATYNSQIGAPHLLLCNGRMLLFFSRDESGKFVFKPGMPGFEELAG